MNIVMDEIVLRAVEQDDSEKLRELINDAEIESMIGGWSFPVSKQRQAEWINGLSNSCDLKLAIEYKGEFVGMVMLTSIDMKNGNAETHVKLCSESRGKGIGSRAVSMVCRYAFDELRLHVIYAEVKEDNYASQNLFAKLGFSKDGIVRERIYKDGKYFSSILFSITKGEFNNAKK